MAELKVQIGADTGELKKALSDAERALAQFGKEASDINNQLKKNAISSAKLSKETEDLNRDFKAGTISENAFGRGLLEVSKAEKKLASDSSMLSSRLLKVNKAASQLGNKGLKSAGKSAANAVPAMTEFSRVIQDAPFGIQGVANNIQQLTSQFGHLTTKLGGSKAALKAMLSTLAGPTGILLAVSVVTSLLVSFGDQLFKAKDKAKELKEEQERLTKSLKDYEDQLDSVRKAQLIGGRASASELTNLKLLKVQTQDTTRDLGHRKKALAELQKLYPSYFKNLTTDIKDQRDLGFAFVRLISRIEDLNKAKAAAGLIAKNQRKLTLLEIQREQKLDELTRLGIAKDKAKGKSLLVKSKASEKYNEKQKEFEEILGQINPLLKRNAELIRIVRESGGVVPLDFSVKEFKPKDVKAFKVSASEDIVGLDTIIKNYSNRIDSAGVRISKKFTDSTELKLQGINLSAVDLSLELLKMKLARLTEDLNATITESIAPTFMALGSAIGAALAEGANVLDAVGQSIVSSLGGLLSAMGQKLIELGTAAVLAGTVVKLFGTIAGIGAGLAAIAGGVVLSAIGSSVDSGQQNRGSDTAGVGGASTSSRGFSRGGGGGGFASSGGGTVVFEIDGVKLVGVLSRTLDRNKALGGRFGLST